MSQKDPIRAAVSVLFLVIAVGIKVAWNQMQPPAPSSALGAFQTNNPSWVKIEFATNHGAKDFVTVKDGMTLAQVKDAFRLVSVGEAEPIITNEPEVLAVFLNPDGSSIEIIFRDGKVAAKQIYNLQETLDNAKIRPLGQIAAQIPITSRDFRSSFRYKRCAEMLRYIYKWFLKAHFGHNTDYPTH